MAKPQIFYSESRVQSKFPPLPDLPIHTPVLTTDRPPRPRAKGTTDTKNNTSVTDWNGETQKRPQKGGRRKPENREHFQPKSGNSKALPEQRALNEYFLLGRALAQAVGGQRTPLSRKCMTAQKERKRRNKFISLRCPPQETSNRNAWMARRP